MKLEFYKDKHGEYRWRLRAANNKVIADSGEGYHNEADCRAGWFLVANAGEDWLYATEDRADFPEPTPDFQDVETVYPCAVHPDDSVCEATDRAECHA